ncbi:MAG: tetratricopeptide repeat protein [Bacteroidetes bacterium]|nr:tetratricopeptide repeat protein [Bacteroidota bacterium]
MQIKFNLIYKKTSIVILSTLFLYGCGVWTNFTTYFNLYYDTSSLFEQAENDIKQQKRDLFSNEDIALPQSANASLAKVVEKCSQILQFHAESSYVDDALIMLGKSFYYQANYQKALRKFEELIATQPKSNLILETQLWIGKTQIKLKDYDNGLIMLKSVQATAQKNDDNKIAQDALIEQAKYYIYQKDYNRAIDFSNQLLKVSDDEKIKAEVAYELGKLYNKINDPQNAINSFEKVTTYSPTYDVEFKSQIALGKTLRETAQNDQALKVFDSMSKQQKNSDVMDEIFYQRGMTLFKMNRLKEAVDQLIIVDTSYSRTSSAGLASLELGRIFLNEYKNFDSAGYYFNRAIISTAPQDSIAIARTHSELLKKYKLLYSNYNNDLHEYNYALDPSLFIKDSIAYVNEIEELKREKADSLGYIFGNIDTMGTAQSKTDSLDIAKRKADSLAIANRRADSLLTRNEKLGDVNMKLNLAPQTQVVEKKPPVRPTQPIDTLKYQLVKSEFDLGNLLFTEFNLPDSAYKYYTDILTNYAGTSFQGSITYALGSYYLTINDTVKADSIFNYVYDNFKNESIVNAAADKLKKPFVDFNFDPASKLYSSAEAQMLNGKYDSSAANFYKIYLTHPKSPYAAQALYATGWILSNKLNKNDSAVVVYDTLTNLYPKTVYAQNVLPQLNYYRKEIARIKKAAQDSLLALASKSKIDSLKSDSTLVKKEKLAALTNESSVNQNKDTNIPGKNVLPKETKQAKTEENVLLTKNNQTSPDTLIRIRGKGLRRKLRE